jgi:hypothetical protein
MFKVCIRVPKDKRTGRQVSMLMDERAPGHSDIDQQNETVKRNENDPIGFCT